MNSCDINEGSDLQHILMCFFSMTGRIPVDLNMCLWEKPRMARRSWVFITGSSSISRKSTTMLITRATKPETTRTR